MNKSSIKKPNRFRVLPEKRQLETGFSMLEAVVVVGVLLALAIGGFFAFGPITENAKIAKVKSAASEVHTGVLVSSMDGDSETSPQKVIDTWNGSTDKIKVEIIPTTTGDPRANGDFCVQATNVASPSITARAGSCNDGAPSGNGNGDGGAEPVMQPAVMKSTWDTSITPAWGPNCTTIKLPLTGVVDATVDWGDGTVEHITTELPSHPYTVTPGIQNIRIDGTFTGWVGENRPLWSEPCITKITEWGETGTTDATFGLSYTTNLTEVARLPLSVTSFSNLAYNSDFNGDVSGWDTSNVTNMEYVFQRSAFNNSSLVGWDTSNVTNMTGAFSDAVKFNQPIGSWNTSSLINASSLFEGASAFNQPIGQWNTSKVENIYGIFRSAAAFNQDISGWDTSNVSNMQWAFSGSAFNNNSLAGWDTSNVTDMMGAFSWSSFNGDISDWDASNLTNMANMFSMSSFNGDISGWRTPNVTNMSGLFQGNAIFNGNISGWDTSSVTDMTSMFNGATTFNGNIAGWNTSNVTVMYAMFTDAASFSQDLSGWNVSNVTEAGEFRTGSGLTIEQIPQSPYFQ